MNDPTKEQSAIIQETKSCVVIAKPGSGKTYTLAYKIRDILNITPPHKGVIAISFTNKASDELEERALKLSVAKKSSFFGTIDRFCLSELVKPFFRHEFGLPTVEVEVKKIAESQFLNDLQKKELLENIKNNIVPDIDFIKKIFLQGEVLLELAGKMAIYLFDKNKVLKNYLLSKYSHIIIDEYQDSGFDQHNLFLRFHELGLTAIAVGDLDQSIYRFAGKSSDFLLSLTNRQDFKKYSLTVNHRCHASISAYSIKLINPDFKIQNPEELRVYLKTVTGSETDQAKWIEDAIPKLKDKFKLNENSDFGLLTRTNNTAKIVGNSFKKHQIELREETPLDSIRTNWAYFFIDALTCFLEPKIGFNQVFEKYLEIDYFNRTHKEVLRNLIQSKENFLNSEINLESVGNILIKSAENLFPESEKINSSKALRTVLSSGLVNSYKPKNVNCVQIMTLHKAKGLEFKIVFHLDLHEWIIPSYDALSGNQDEMIQSRNLHYVGITRAREACIFVTSSRRTNSRNLIIDAQLSQFLVRGDLQVLRKSLN